MRDAPLKLMFIEETQTVTLANGKVEVVYLAAVSTLLKRPGLPHSLKLHRGHD